MNSVGFGSDLGQSFPHLPGELGFFDPAASPALTDVSSLNLSSAFPILCNNWDLQLNRDLVTLNLLFNLCKSTLQLFSLMLDGYVFSNFR